MTHIFKEGDVVVSKRASNDFLPAGSHGTVFCFYMTTPPAYEINFIDIRGRGFGAVMYEDELELCPNPDCLHTVEEKL